MITVDHVITLRPFLTLPLFQSDHQNAELTSHGQEALDALLRIIPLTTDLWSLIHHFGEDIQQNVNLEDGSDDEKETMQQSIAYSLSVAVIICVKCHASVISYFMPSVHSHLFTLQQFLPFVHSLFDCSETEVIQKGLSLLKHLLQNVGEKSLRSSFYDILIRHPVHESLVRIMRFSPDADCRKNAVLMFKSLILTFDPIGRVAVVTFLISDPKQKPGIIELLLNQYRHFIIHESSSVYSGNSLKAVLVKSIDACFRFSEKADSPDSSDDLVRQSESILALLNFIRFLLLSETRDVTGITSMKPVIRDRLIVPMKRELTSNRGKLEQELVRLRKLDSRSKAEAVDQIRSMHVEIGNDSLDGRTAKDDFQSCPTDFQEQGVQMSVIKIDMIQSVVDRVEELVM